MKHSVRFNGAAPESDRCATRPMARDSRLRRT